MSNMSQIRELSIDVNSPQFKNLIEWSNNLNVKVKATKRLVEMYDENRSITNTRSSIKCLKKEKMNIIKNIRGIYLHINRSKHVVFTFYKMSLWKTFMIKRNILINDIYDVRNKELWCWNNKEIKYIELCIKTLSKYEDYGKFVACVVHRTFCYDIAWQILDYI
jgi:hypothetical protein